MKRSIANAYGTYRKHLPELIKYIRYTQLRLKDGYLVDCCLPDIYLIIQILSDECYFPLSVLSELTIIVIKDDIIIVNNEVFSQKRRLLSSIDWTSHVIISIDNDEPKVLHETIMLDEISSLVSNLLDSSSLVSVPSLVADRAIKVLTVIECPEFERKVGYAFLAGWLLGYACIYRSTNPQYNCLSNVALRKFTLSLARCDGKEEDHACIQQFTIPESLLLDDDSSSASRGVHSLVARQVERIASRLAELGPLAWAPASDSPAPYKVVLATATVVSPAVSL